LKAAVQILVKQNKSSIHEIRELYFEQSTVYLKDSPISSNKLFKFFEIDVKNQMDAKNEKNKLETGTQFLDEVFLERKSFDDNDS
jgi:hypothetical protein